MREILFRAKGLYKDCWYYGNYVEHKKAMQSYIIDLDEEVMSTDHFVDKNTLGQYTGLTDKNGTKIFEGDIITAKHNIEQYNVYWKDYRFYIEDVWGNLIKPTQEAINHFECKVIGNIYDNPELIGGLNERQS